MLAFLNDDLAIRGDQAGNVQALESGTRNLEVILVPSRALPGHDAPPYRHPQPARPALPLLFGLAMAGDDATTSVLGQRTTTAATPPTWPPPRQTPRSPCPATTQAR